MEKVSGQIKGLNGKKLMVQIIMLVAISFFELSCSKVKY